MRFSCDSSLLKRSINLLTSILPGKYTHPALSGILIKGKKGYLSLSSFNLSVGLELTISPEQIQGDFQILVPGVLLNKLISTIIQSQSTNSFIEFEIDKNNNKLLVSNASGTVAISLLDPEDFPLMPQNNNQEEYIEIDLISLQNGIFRITGFTGDASKFVLGGINFKSNNHELCLTATNGHTVGMAYIPIENNIQMSKTLSKDFLDFFNKFLRIFEIQDLTLPIYFDDGQVFFNLDLPTFKARISGRLIEGVYPDITKIIPANFEYTIRLVKQELLNVLNIVECVSTDVGKLIDADVIQISITKQECCITYFPIPEREVKQVIPLEYSNVENFVFGINKKYLLAQIKSIPNSLYIELQFNTSTTPILIRGTEEPIKEMGIIMPISPKTN